MTGQPHVYIIIVNYRHWRDTLECVQSLLASSFPEFSIRVVDNASGNGSLEQLRAALSMPEPPELIRSEEPGKLVMNKPGRLTLVQHDVNAGFAAANNMVLKALLDKEGYVWLLNPDMTVEPGTMQQLVSFNEQDSNMTVTGAVIKSYHDKTKTLIRGGGLINTTKGTVKMNAGENNPPDYISGASMFTKLAVFRLNGLLPEEYFLVWEETDWCYAARQKGVKMQVCKQAVCYDKISTSIGKGFAAQYYYTRNGLHFMARYFPDRVEQAVAAARWRLTGRILTGRWAQAGGIRRGIADFLKKKYHAME